MRVLRGFVWLLWAVLCVGIAAFSFRYVVGVGPLPPSITSNMAGTTILAAHAATAGIALLVTPFQFLTRMRTRWPRVHRIMGRIYVSMAMIGGVTGLPLAIGSTAGPIAAWGFGLLAVITLGVTGRAWWLATQRRIDEHREWMVRSFALISAGVTLRIYLGLIFLLPVEFIDAYRAIAFLCWIPNLILAELYLLSRRRRPAVRPAVA